MELFTTATKEHDELRQGEAYISTQDKTPFTKFFLIESYGCAMNFADSEVVASILEKNGRGKKRCLTFFSFSKKVEKVNRSSWVAT